MTILPSLQSDLVAAARRRNLRSRTPRRAALLVLVLGTAVAGTATAAVITGVLGGPPRTPVPRVSAEERAGMMRTRDPRVLGRLQLGTSAQPVELIGYRMKGYRGQGSLLCLDLANPNGTRSGGCSPDLPIQRRGLIGRLLGPDPDGPSIAVGATRVATRQVTIRYRADGRWREVSAELLQVPKALAAGLQTEPFTYYAAPIPASASVVSAIVHRAPRPPSEP